MALDSYNGIKAAALGRAGEETDGTSDFDDRCDDAIIEVWREIITRQPWLGLTKHPPGVFVTAAPITTLTLTVVTAGTGVARTLSAAPAGSVSILGRKVRPSGVSWIARITAHNAGETDVTLDAAPAILAASACTIFQDEYTLASDLGLFVDGLWTQDGHFIELVDEERFKTEYADPPDSGYPARWFCRLTRTKIRLSTYPTAVKRHEYPYTYEPATPSGSATLAIDAHLRPALLQGVLAILYNVKGDNREKEAATRYEKYLELGATYERRLKTGLGQRSQYVMSGPYQ